MPDFRQIPVRCREQGQRALERVRHARHPLHGWRRWAVIAIQAAVGLLLLFALVNLALWFSIDRPGGPVRQALWEAEALFYSPLDGDQAPDHAFTALYGDVLGADPDATAIRTYFEAQVRREQFVLEHVMVQRMLTVNGGLDARVFPTGVYVGLRAIGPDEAPMVYVTRHLAHFMFFPRHAYILVVPEHGEARAFSASVNDKLGDDVDNPDHLRATLQAYDMDAYDFPASGQAIHLMIRISDEVASDALERLETAVERLEEAQVTYGVLAPNSNTVIGCLLEDADVMTRAERSGALLALRAPGLGADCV
ncbi:hypothetical protein [Brevundimonas sp.]|uniref:hypothetical protein n=1 Tax=Brevundimonas sp. TaxID=1871086 RepID=UPI003918AC3F